MKKKILLFTDSIGSGGAQRQLVGLSVLLKNHGFDVKVCTYFDYDFYKLTLTKNNIPYEIIPNAADYKKRIFYVYNYFKSENPHWIVAYQETPSMIACIAKLLGCRFKLLVSERNTSQSLGLRERIRFFLYRFADAVVPNSFAQAKFLLNSNPWIKPKLHTITNFVDLEHFGFVKHVKSCSNIIVVAASLLPSKNPVGLIKAAKILKDKHFKFRIDWYGKISSQQSYIAQCQLLIDSYGLSSYVRLLDKTQQIYIKYAQCDFFCLPSFYEGTPNVICEAIATGRPVICSDICDNSHYVLNNKNGFLFDPKNPQDIASAIEKALLLSQSEYESFSNVSRTLAESKLDKKVFLNKYLSILLSDLNEK